jgi:uncharacterized protein (AIM24 family)
VKDVLAGSVAPVLSISLEPGESIVAAAGEFAWMTDSIQMTAAESLSKFTARGRAGTIAFAGKQPGGILKLDISPAAEYLVHRHGFLAGTEGVQLQPGFRQSVPSGLYADGFVLQRVTGTGQAWIELAGEIVRLELAAGESLRAHPWHVGLLAASVDFQLTRVPELANRYFDPDAHHFAVMSGPGPVWLQSTPALADLPTPLPHTLPQ